MKRLLVLLMLTMQSVVGIFAAVIHPYDVAAKNKEGITIYYRYINDGKELELSVRQENTYFNGEVEWVDSYQDVESLVIPDVVCFSEKDPSGKITKMGQLRVTSIRNDAFLFCKKLVSVKLPCTLKQIEKNAFYGCENLQSIVIPDSVTSIGSYAFYDCMNLEAIELGEQLSWIGSFAFDVGSNHTSQLKTLISHIKEPSNLTDFQLPHPYVNGKHISTIDATLYVPKGTIEKYKSQYGWRDFKRIEEFENPVNDVYEVTISQAGYATFYDSHDAYSLPKELSAQIVTGVVDGRLIYETIAEGKSGGVIPKGVAVMLTNENLQGGKFTLSRSNSDVTYKGINLLHGTDDIKNTTRWANSYTYLYKLSYGPSDGEFADTFGWYWGAKDGGSFLIDGHTAWLAIPGASSTRSFIVDSTTTDVDLMDCTRKRVIYNIKGQHAEMINNKGLYVVNGRIVLIK